MHNFHTKIAIQYPSTTHVNIKKKKAVGPFKANPKRKPALISKENHINSYMLRLVLVTKYFIFRKVLTTFLILKPATCPAKLLCF